MALEASSLYCVISLTYNVILLYGQYPDWHFVAFISCADWVEQCGVESA